MPESASSTCWPQPDQVALLHSIQVTLLHISISLIKYPPRTAMAEEGDLTQVNLKNHVL